MFMFTLVQIIGNVFSSYKYIINNSAENLRYFKEPIFIWTNLPDEQATVIIVYIVGLPLVIWGIMLFRKRLKEKGIKLKTSLKWAFFLIVLFVVIAITLIVFSNDESYYSDYYQRKEKIFYPENENNIPPNVYKQNNKNTNQHFGKMLIDDINRQMINKQINELPSESENYYDFGLDQYFP